jgi:hypothetical protein
LLTAVPFFVVGATWRLPDTYHSAGSERGTATLKVLRRSRHPHLTLISFNPTYQVHPELPATASFTLVLSLIDDEDPEPTLVDGVSIRLSFGIVDPDGVKLAGFEQTTDAGRKRYPELPGTVTLAMAVVLGLKKYGKYVAEVEVGIGDQTLKTTRALYIVPK